MSDRPALPRQLSTLFGPRDRLAFVLERSVSPRWQFTGVFERRGLAVRHFPAPTAGG